MLKRNLSSEEPKQIVSEEFPRALSEDDVTLPSRDTRLTVAESNNGEQAAALLLSINESDSHITKKFKTAPLVSVPQSREAMLQPMVKKLITHSDHFKLNNNKKGGRQDKDQPGCSEGDAASRDILKRLGLSEYSERILTRPYFKKAVEYLEKYADIFRKDGFADKIIVDIIIRCTAPNRGLEGLKLLAEESTRAFLKQLGFTPADMEKCLSKSFGSAKIIKRILNTKDLLGLRKEEKITVEKIISLAQNEQALGNYIKIHKRVEEEVVALDPQLYNNNIAIAFFNQGSDSSNMDTNLTMQN